METSIKEQYLEQFQWAKQEVRDLEREIKLRRDDNNFPSSVPYDREFVTGSKDVDNSVQVKNLYEILEMEKEQLERRHLCLQLEKQIREAINKIPVQSFRRILTKRYLLGLKLSDIATEINYSTSRTCELAKQALDAFEMPADPIWM